MKDTVILRNEGFINVEVIPMCGSDNIVLSSSHSIGNDYRGNNIILSTKGQHKLLQVLLKKYFQDKVKQLKFR